ncbi:hypothetical protein HNY73_018772 [Argiope bruennichi]|uniref:Uncharacterized protein n=1 Tax=Argiope bruennichi TaxID=94029 RepID=A0A8T0EEA3_ARGBR|nr:hypothetical protein HNY73_018772 [Argiope bruennichi]
MYEDNEMDIGTSGQRVQRLVFLQNKTLRKTTEADFRLDSYHGPLDCEQQCARQLQNEGSRKKVALEILVASSESEDSQSHSMEYSLVP